MKTHHLEPLEIRRLMAVHFAIDATQNVHSISRYIYGVNQSISGDFASATLTRSGGNRLTAYNWENNASNAGSDYLFQNDAYLGGGDTPGGAIAPMLANASANNAGALVTIPMAGYVSADKNGGGDVHYTGNTWNGSTWVNGTPNPNYLSQRFKVALPRKGSAFTLTPDTNDVNVYQDEFVNWIKQTYPYSLTDPNRPIWFDLDNEPDLWNATHAEVHPAAPTYAEMVQRTTDYASAIKDVAPNALIFGPVNYGWQGYVRLQNAPDANNRDFQEFFLQQMKAASTAAGRRLLDVMDVHWYPEAHGTNNIRITENDNSAATVAARLQAPRSLWDPTYTESSWITQSLGNKPINLIPRLQTKINTYYPGTKLSITEYNYGGANHISGGIAEADVLGIFGRDGVFAANEWALQSAEPFIAGGLKMYRNYDGAGSAFGDTSIKASTDDVANSSVYASVSSTNPDVLTVVAINRSASSLPAVLNLSNIRVGAQGSVYQLIGPNSNPTFAGTLSITDPANVNYTMLPSSVITIRIPIITPPTVTSANFAYQSSPNTVTFNFSEDVHASLAAADLQITSLDGGGAPVIATYAGYGPGNTATFSLPTPLADGNYRATLLGSGVTDAAGNPMDANYTFDFFSLAGDANHDRVVDVTDLGVLATNWQSSGANFSQGDFNYDGAVDVTDLGALATNWQKSVAAPAPAIAAATNISMHRDSDRRSLVDDVLA